MVSKIFEKIISKCSGLWRHLRQRVTESPTPCFSLLTAQALPYYLALTFYIWVSWQKAQVCLWFRKEVQAMATLPQGQEPSPLCNPKLIRFPYFLKPFLEQLRHSPFSPQKALYSNNELFIPSWPMCDIMCLDIWTKVWMRAAFLWEVIVSEKQQSPRITSTVRKATRSLKGRLGNCTVPLQLDGYWPQQVPKPTLHSC